jgi:hypothetical protein
VPAIGRALGTSQIGLQQGQMDVFERGARAPTFKILAKLNAGQLKRSALLRRTARFRPSLPPRRFLAESYQANTLAENTSLLYITAMMEADQ